MAAAFDRGEMYHEIGSLLMQNGTEKDCLLNVTSGEFDFVRVSTSILNSLVAVACIVVIILFVILKLYLEFFYRLVIYLVVITVCYMLNDALQLSAFESVNSSLNVTNDAWCSTLGFFNQLFGWLALLVVCSLTLHLLLLSTFAWTLHSKTREIVGIILAVCVSLFFSILPLIPSNGIAVYGQFGINCWIRRTDNSCGLFIAGIIEQFFLWYIPLICAFVFIVVTLGRTIQVLYRHRKATQITRLDDVISEVWMLFIYLLIFTVIYLIALIPRLVNIGYSQQSTSLILDAVVQPCLMLILPIAIVLHPSTIKKLRLMCTKAKKTVVSWSHRGKYEVILGHDFPDDHEVTIRDTKTDTHFEVPPEFSSEGVEKLVIK